MTPEEKAKEWFNKNYHTPMDSVLAKYGVPELLGIHEDGQEHWEDIPFEEILVKYAKEYHQVKMKEIKPCKNVGCSNPFMINLFENRIKEL